MTRLTPLQPEQTKDSVKGTLDALPILFFQFKHDGKVHTAAFTRHVTG
jgi:hypothetical protein